MRRIGQNPEIAPPVLGLPQPRTRTALLQEVRRRRGLRHCARSPTIVRTDRAPTSVGRMFLGKAPKRGNRYLRVLFVKAAWVVLAKPLGRERHASMSGTRLRKRRRHESGDRAVEQARASPDPFSPGAAASKWRGHRCRWQAAQAWLDATTLSDSRAPQPVRACTGRLQWSWQNR